MGQPNNILVFALGSLGALVPEIYRLYKLRRKVPKEVFSWWYYLVSFAWAFVGGVFAWVLPSENLRTALYAGISLPMVISTIAKHPPHEPETIQAVNQAQSFIKAHDRTPSRMKRFVELLRDHADGLFQ